jgi:hypothetical protein
LFRAWQIQNPDGSAAPLSCDNGDIQIAPHYGYENQMAIWLQMLGQSEIGRVYVGLVPHEEQWYVGSFHYHQWTHKGDNFELWFQRAQADMTQELYPAAYVKLDMAAKLVGGSKFFELPIKDEIERLQQSVIEKKMWEESIKTSLKDQKPIVHMGSIFASEGAGLLIHFEIEKEMTTQEIKDDCSKVTAALNQHKWFQSIAGVKCNYVFRGADPTREGPMGGIFMTSSPVSAPKK